MYIIELLQVLIVLDYKVFFPFLLSCLAYKIFVLCLFLNIFFLYGFKAMNFSWRQKQVLHNARWIPFEHQGLMANIKTKQIA
jgi:hypothetical protein